ncbi:MAG: hypothetical protein HYZ53_10455 [Planctomycetes bacterium]|nr:hypothetical protein [Planctomycetota bacterium]
MLDFLTAIATYPTLVFSGMLSLVVVYWLFVVLGTFDPRSLDPADGGGDEVGAGGHDAGGHELAGQGDGGHALGGHGDGHELHAGDGGAHDVHAGEDAQVGHDAHAGHDGHEGSDEQDHDQDEGGLAGLLSALGLRGVPLTVVLSLVILFAWLASLGLMEVVGDIQGLWLRRLVGSGVGLVALSTGLLLTSVALRPLRGLFVVTTAASNTSFVGRECTIRSQRVDEEFGQAEIEDGGAGLVVQVRCRNANQLTQGSKAIVYAYDREQAIFHVAPADPEPPRAPERARTH